MLLAESPFASLPSEDRARSLILQSESSHTFSHATLPEIGNYPTQFLSRNVLHAHVNTCDHQAMASKKTSLSEHSLQKLEIALFYVSLV